MHYNHKLINDLAWAIGSACLLDNTQDSDDVFLSTSWSENQLNRYSELLAQQDRSPQLIQKYMVEHCKDCRLGSYFENLIAYWFSINPDYSILQRNLVIKSPATNHTIGEFDLILENDKNNQHLHLEMAVKFYLQLNVDNRTYWFGPNAKDRLDIKLDRILSHQIKLSDNPEVKQLLLEKNITITDKKVLLKGRLFKHAINLEQKYIWMTASEFSSIKKDEFSWIQLDKPWWFTEIADVSSHFLASEIILHKDIVESLNRESFKHPVCLAMFKHTREINRIFVVPDSWPDYARSLIS